MREKTCCFTGHRDLPQTEIPAITKRTEEAVRHLISKGVRYFGVGGAIGFDTLAAKILFRLREREFPQIKVILVKPFESFTSRWTEQQKEEFAALLPHYDKVVCISKSASRGAYLARDRHLVDNSAYCVCCCTKDTEGTAYTVRYARQRGVAIFNVADRITRKEPGRYKSFL